MGKFKERTGKTLIGTLIEKAAPHLIDTVEGVFPAAKILTQLIETDPKISDEDKMKFHELMANEEERERFYALENTKGAREIYTDSKDIVDKIAMRVINWNLPLIFLVVAINIACIKFLDSTLLAIASNVLGMILNKLFEERSVVMNFYFGAMKKVKDKFSN